MFGGGGSKPEVQLFKGFGRHWFFISLFTFYIVQLSHSLLRSNPSNIGVENFHRPIARGYLFLGLADLLQEAGSPGGRPFKVHISASIGPAWFYNHSICSDNCRIYPLEPTVFAFPSHYLLKWPLLCQSRLFTFGQGHLICRVGHPQGNGQNFMSFQHW